MDGALIYGDVSVAAYRALAGKRPIAALRLGPLVIFNRARFKRRLAQAQTAPAVRLRADFVAWLRAQHAAGRRLHLITGADQAHADAVAGPLALFDTIEGSNGQVNLVGPAKARRLTARFPDGFSYAGDSVRDLPVFAAAQSIVLAGASAQVARAAKALGVPIEARFS